MPDPSLISVRTQVVLDTLVGTMADAVASRLDEPLGPEVEAALAAAGGDAPLARMGYLARGVEIERFERAREPMPWLADRAALGRDANWSEAAAALAAELAAGEPPGRPDPDDDAAVTWKVPGPGGHVRHYLALRATSGDDGGLARLDGKRPWLIGFLLHCIEEAAPPAGWSGAVVSQ